MTLIPTNNISKALALLDRRKSMIDEMEKIEKISIESSVVKIAPIREQARWDGMFVNALEITELVNLDAIRHHLWGVARAHIKEIDEELASLGFAVNAP